MSGPTGLIFALRARVSSATGTEQLYGEANTGFSGVIGSAGDLKDVPGLLIHTDGTANATNTVYASGSGKTIAAGEDDVANEMTFTIEKLSVAAGTRALKGSYSMELAQDLRAVHGLDAEGELANILSSEILAEINREVVRKIYIAAKVSDVPTTNTGVLKCNSQKTLIKSGRLFLTIPIFQRLRMLIEER